MLTQVLVGHEIQFRKSWLGTILYLMDNHMHNHHEGFKLFICAVCGKGLQLVKMLKNVKQAYKKEWKNNLWDLLTLKTFLQKCSQTHKDTHAHRNTPQSQSIGLIQTETRNRGNGQICTNTHWRLCITKADVFTFELHHTPTSTA